MVKKMIIGKHSNFSYYVVSETMSPLAGSHAAFASLSAKYLTKKCSKNLYLGILYDFGDPFWE